MRRPPSCVVALALCVLQLGFSATAPVHATSSASSAPQSSASAARGLNLPSQHADTNQGNFLPVVFSYDSYDMSQIQHANFSSVRLGINVQTAHHAPTLAKLRGYVEAFQSAAECDVLLCMWDTLLPGQTGHGDGLVNNVTAMGEAWKIAAEAFESTQVKFEVFNEPFGYKTSSHYLEEMSAIISIASLPRSRVVLDGLGYADDVQSVAPHWPGWLAFHIYPNWLPNGQRTQENFSNLVQARLAGVSHRTYITEFGAALNIPTDYEKYHPSGDDGDVNMLRGLNDAVGTLRQRGVGCPGLFYWHGWDNKDSYSFWGLGYPGSSKVARILREA